MRELRVFHKPLEVCAESKMTLEVLERCKFVSGLVRITTDITGDGADLGLLERMRGDGVVGTHCPVLAYFEDGRLKAVKEEPTTASEVLGFLYGNRLIDSDTFSASPGQDAPAGCGCVP